MKNRKAPGADTISAEVLTAGGDKKIKFLQMLFKGCVHNNFACLKRALLKQENMFFISLQKLFSFLR